MVRVMDLYLINHDMKYAVEQALLTLFPGQRPQYPEGAPQGDRAEISLHEGPARFTAVCRLYMGQERFEGRAYAEKNGFTDELARTRLLQRAVKLSFFRAALQSGVEPPVWGSLTGIRPGKLMSRLLEQGLSDKAALSRFIRENGVSPERAELCLHTAHAGLDCAAALRPEDVCLYVGIPFCPTRCGYCSFVSQSVQKSIRLIPKYLEALNFEIEATGELVRELGLRPVSLYLGGGTPTTLSPEQLDRLFEKLEGAFDLSSLRETTVEAGRPDTITAEKLSVLKDRGVTRVSVNPQSMDDAVLEAIGRKHTAADVVSALDLVRRAGDFQVNMDLIAGLPKDTPEGFGRTLEAVLALEPENVTVHTLALKKGSEIMLGDVPRPPAEQVGKMLDMANSALFQEGFRPYYLYRQKYMSGGFENVGWQRGGTENIYNICIMEELCSIISMGGGASTKICAGNGRIERIFDPKYPQEYIEAIERVIQDKKRIKELLRNGI